ncbi:I78 family peptidase inhibitor [Streptomyces sp. LN785]|uniref:I78 family peptidase inhibitor n=1 Tax=Streptomyces sp. LN785 TaxID=3112983 RepID=UPI003710EFBD
MTPVPTPPAQPDDAPDAYVGLAAEAAERRARARGWHTVRALPPGSIITMEFRAGRINFEVDESVVTRCWVG